MRVHSFLFLNVVLYITSACDFVCRTECEKIEDPNKCRDLCKCAEERWNGDTLVAEIQNDTLEEYEVNLKQYFTSLEECFHICNQQFTGDKYLNCSSNCHNKSYLMNSQFNSDTQNNIDDTQCISECTDLCNQQPQAQVTQCLEKCLAERCKITYLGDSKIAKDKVSISALYGVAVAFGAVSWAIAIGYKRGYNKLKEPLLSI